MVSGVRRGLRHVSVFFPLRFNSLTKQWRPPAGETLQGMRRGLDGDLLATGTGVPVF